MIVKCKPTQPEKEPCPYLRYCLARLNDPSITGCGLPLYMARIIRNMDDIYVEHTWKNQGGEDGGDR